MVCFEMDWSDEPKKGQQIFITQSIPKMLCGFQTTRIELKIFLFLRAVSRIGNIPSSLTGPCPEQDFIEYVMD